MSTIARPIRWHGLRINQEQLITAVDVIVCVVLLQLLLHALAARAGRCAPSPTIRRWPPCAASSAKPSRGSPGVLAGALTALSGVLAGLDRAVDPLLGWNYQIPIFAAAILGGLGSPTGAVVGAIVIGLAEELSSLVLPTNYRQVVSFAIILVLLLMRTQGLFGAKAVRK